MPFIFKVYSLRSLELFDNSLVLKNEKFVDYIYVNLNFIIFLLSIDPYNFKVKFNL